VKRAADVLLPWLDRATNADLEADIATALRDARARRYATEPLLRLFTDLIGDDLNGPGPPPTEEAGDRRRLETAVGDALATLARDDHFDQVEALIRDRQHGHYRAYLFSALGHMKNPAAVDLALDMLEDGEVSMPALYALSDLAPSARNRRCAASPASRHRSALLTTSTPTGPERASRPPSGDSRSWRRPARLARALPERQTGTAVQAMG